MAFGSDLVAEVVTQPGQHLDIRYPQQHEAGAKREQSKLLRVEGVGLCVGAYSVAVYGINVSSF